MAAGQFEWRPRFVIEHFYPPESRNPSHILYNWYQVKIASRDPDPSCWDNLDLMDGGVVEEASAGDLGELLRSSSHSATMLRGSFPPWLVLAVGVGRGGTLCVVVLMVFVMAVVRWGGHPWIFTR